MILKEKIFLASDRSEPGDIFVRRSSQTEHKPYQKTRPKPRQTEPKASGFGRTMSNKKIFENGWNKKLPTNYGRQ